VPSRDLSRPLRGAVSVAEAALAGAKAGATVVLADAALASASAGATVVLAEAAA